jgi:hypothetical protein
MNKLGVGIGYRIVCENKHNLNEQNRIKVQPQFVEKEPLTIWLTECLKTAGAHYWKHALLKTLY